MKEEIYHLKEANLMIQAQNATQCLHEGILLQKKKKSSDNNKGKLNENNPSHRCETAKQNSYLHEN